MATKIKSKTKTNPKPPHKQEGPNPVIWVEIPVTDMERAKTFYKKTFGLTYEMVTMHGYTLALFPMSVDCVGTGGALVQGPSYQPSYDGTLIYFTTTDIPVSLKKAVQAGGSVIQSKKAIGQYGFVAYFEDSEGNRIGLHSMK